MKNILTILLVLCSLSCKAQTIIPLYGDQEILVDNSGHYYKDTNNDFNKFIGTWQWSSLNNSITIILKKEEQINDGDGYTYDLLVGEYQYVKNGNYVNNSLSDIDNISISGYEHNISGINIISKYGMPPCEGCNENEKRIKLIIEHPLYKNVTGWLTLRYVVENGIEKIKMTVQHERNISTDPNAPDHIDIPLGEHILIKQ